LIYAQYRKLQYSSSNNNTSIVNITILVIPVSRPAASYYPLIQLLYDHSHNGHQSIVLTNSKARVHSCCLWRDRYYFVFNSLCCLFFDIQILITSYYYWRRKKRCKYYNTGNTSIVTLYNTRNTSIVMLQYRKSSIVYIYILDIPVSCIYNTGIPESLIYAHKYSKTCLNRTNPFGNEEFYQFRQVFGLHRFKLHRYLVDGTVRYRQVFGLLRARYRYVSLYYWYNHR
jgi:hypothetical protein